MTFDYDGERVTPVSLTLANGVTASGEVLYLRINPETLPKDKQWYQIRHADDDGSIPASLKRGCVVVNFHGTFICDPIAGMEDGDEIEITEFNYER